MPSSLNERNMVLSFHWTALQRSEGQLQDSTAHGDVVILLHLQDFNPGPPADGSFCLHALHPAVQSHLLSVAIYLLVTCVKPDVCPLATTSCL